MPVNKLIPDMSKSAIKKLLVVALAFIRKVCEEKEIDFLDVVHKSIKNEMSLDAIDQIIGAFNEENPEEFLKYLGDNSTEESELPNV
jgi:hypothetical protein